MNTEHQKRCIDYRDHEMVIDGDTMYCKKCDFVLFRQEKWVKADDGMEYDTSRLRLAHEVKSL